MEKQPFYITTTLPYVNSDPHVGFALEIVQADAIARGKRLLGRDVFFNTGTDEHGQKIANEADKAGKERQKYVDEYAQRFERLKDTLNLSVNAFIRTTDLNHERAAKEMWKRCEASGDIYKKKYEGLYCVGCEMFLRPSDLVGGKCPNHPNRDPEEVEEENYFFKLSNYQSYLEEYLSRPDAVVPEWRREEALAFVKEGLEDFSISRQRSRLDWGIPVPGDENQVMYVWFDALTNYISTLGWPEDKAETFKTFWENGYTLQTAGKDQVRFQSIMWQAMLKSAGLPATDSVLYHGFITSGGQKMSKSLGNVINPDELIEQYGVDAARYILLGYANTFEDSDLTWEKMDELYNGYLANGLGNLVARVMKMSENHLTAEEVQAEVGFYELKEGEVKLEGTRLGDFVQKLESHRLRDAFDVIWSEVAKQDELIAEEEPFKVVKADVQKGKNIILNRVQGLWGIAVMLEPFMPETSVKIKQAVKENKKPETLFQRKN